ncbi:unnamed protein product [Pleuronectes platessa]|uniref:Secreted protein n=1 Tax=Pleuronectes platessa TaxID=8262 RepID=A0A9N7ZBD5_PLEPL|nr:unnamed protein product [Pleuronectes platessa]
MEAAAESESRCRCLLLLLLLLLLLSAPLAASVSRVLSVCFRGCVHSSRCCCLFRRVPEPRAAGSPVTNTALWGTELLSLYKIGWSQKDQCSCRDSTRRGLRAP